jgi:hypothetical protein
MTAEAAAPFVSAGDAVLEVRRASAAARLASLSPRTALNAEGDALEAGVPFVPTGWTRLDAALGGGLAIPSLNVLGAAPKSGKSTWAQIVAVRHVEAGGVAYCLDLENGRRRYFGRLLCRLAGIGPKEAQRDRFTSKAAAAKWTVAKAKLRDELGGLLVEFSPPENLEERLRDVRAFAGERRLLIVIDSLQKLPGSLEDRRATIDGWIRFLERLRLDLDAAILVISEIKRNGKGEYQAHESAFKESGLIEYAADLAMTLTRPRADEDEEAVSTLRVELARDCDEDPRGDVASYAPVRPFYGLEERDPAPRRGSGRRGPRAEKTDAARDWLEEKLASGPVSVEEVLRDGETAGHSRTRLYEARKGLGVDSCTLSLGSAWRLA